MKVWHHPTRQEIAENLLVWNEARGGWTRDPQKAEPGWWFKSRRGGGASSKGYCSICRGPHKYKHGRS